MKTISQFLITSAVFIVLMTGCAAAEEQSQPDYESTKKMMVDMLQTDEGKQSIQEILQDEEVQQSLIIEDEFVKDTIQETLTTEKGKEFWQVMMEDPEFAQTFAESMQEENEQVLKHLMNDPEYQEMMMEILKDPEMEQSYLELMESKEYRQQVMNVMNEALESPLFVGKLKNILDDVVEEQMNQQNENQEEGNEGEE
ncbi:spore germination lipoprotein GerD [Texcoconibacillus texcoconensis]|uniref:Spore germination protein D n=1 Tax=Texcoconibacillus texcoconensis TaxID=1095777 RepID=A0A840QUL5_9BACI|nr:spore germination protein D [Texcoconibacillus texcoconensis]